MKTKAVLTVAILLAALYLGATTLAQGTNTSDQGWQEEYNLSKRELSDTGESTYFILIPGFQTVLESEDAKLTITVLDETEEIGEISTRVVEEREEVDGALYEVSRNFYAIDEETGDVFYFGEEVDFYDKVTGKITGHEGSWLAYENGNEPGLIMPGAPEVGMKYYQELAPGQAMDRAEVISLSETLDTPAGEFENSLLTLESTPLDSDAREYKTYAQGIGLIQDQTKELVSYGYVEETDS